MTRVRHLDVSAVTGAVARLCVEACRCMPGPYRKLLEAARAAEESPAGREVLALLLENAATAEQERIPLCQDCGMTLVYLEAGQEVHFTGGSLEEAVAEGVRRGYRDGYLRSSVVDDPLFRRRNTGDNTPALLHARLVAGRKVRLTVVPRGGGSDNSTALAMLKPGDGVKGLVRFVLQVVEEAGADPCPPLMVGVGVGGSAGRAVHPALLATLRPPGERSPEPDYARLEEELLCRINALGIGPAGLGGRYTALGVAVEKAPCHMASLPVSVCLQCNAYRHATTLL